MNIFFIRHAEAIDHETDTVRDDEYRFITSNGRNVTRKVAKFLAEELFDLDIIFTSPLIRAVQTAEIFADELEFKKEVALVNELRNEISTESLRELLQNNSNLTSVALVGHEPKLSLLVKSFSGKTNFYDFRKSSVCLIEFNPESGAGKFNWYFDSKKMEFDCE